MKGRLAVRGLLVLAAAAVGLSVVATTGPAARADEPRGLGLEPIGGFTDLPTVRILTNEVCPAPTKSIVVRIGGGGFRPDTNIVGNTDLRVLEQRTDQMPGMAVPIFANWEYLATTQGAQRPLNGEADLTLLCTNGDLEPIYARMTGKMRFVSTPGQKTTYEQIEGPRIATGLPGIPPPGRGGVPLDAPVAANAAASRAPQKSALPNLKLGSGSPVHPSPEASAEEAENTVSSQESSEAAANSAQAPATENVALNSASATSEKGMPIGLLFGSLIALAGAAWLYLVHGRTRRY